MSSSVRVGRGSAAWPAVAVAAGLSVAVQLWGLYVPDPPVGADWFRGADKVQHGLAFGLPVALIMLADSLRRRSRGLPPRARVLVASIWIFAAHAVLSEVIQGAWYADRVGDPLDLLADWSGITVAGMLTGLGIGLRRPGRVRPAQLGHGGVARHG
jgi:hypothetical protein